MAKRQATIAYPFVGSRVAGDLNGGFREEHSHAERAAGPALAFGAVADGDLVRLAGAFHLQLAAGAFGCACLRAHARSLQARGPKCNAQEKGRVSPALAASEIEEIV
jgi:hypothetical protein